MDAKRLFDVFGAAAGLLTLGPLALGAAFTMAALHKTSPFFKQARIGLNRKPFAIIKVKTMTDQRGPDGALLPDPLRTGKFGIFLRKSRIDEIPQFINVLRGEMSLVGPRPVVPFAAESKDIERHNIRPGLTGPAQIAGKNGLSIEEVLKLDHDYVRRPSLTGDFMILLKTPLSLIRNRKVLHYNPRAQTALAQPEKRILIP